MMAMGETGLGKTDLIGHDWSRSNPWLNYCCAEDEGRKSWEQNQSYKNHINYFLKGKEMHSPSRKKIKYWRGGKKAKN